MEAKKIFWRKSAALAELHTMLKTLGDEYPIGEGSGSFELRFKKTDRKGALKVSVTASGADIEYNGVNCAARGVGAALGGMSSDESLVFETFGIMLDCSRNAVMKVAHLKKWLRRLALLGYNMAMLYTEDTYELPGEPYFGYMRGAYTLDEMKEVDEYASRLGIDMIPCIQTLGHLEKMLRWHGAYDKVKDTSTVMLVDEDATYRLIEKMLSFWSEAFKSRRVHIGMDETHDLGRGRFMDKFGHQRGFDIFNRHLAKVGEMCKKHGLKPMIWSDMYFRMGSSRNDYYDKAAVIPEDVKNAIPKDTDLVYWDYYHYDYDFYADWIKRHRALGHEPIMGSGAWTWVRWWYDAKQTEDSVRPCVDACRDLGLKEFFVTLWGDDGAYCEFDSVYAGLCWIAELAFGGKGEPDRLEKMFGGIFNSSYAKHIAASKLEFVRGKDGRFHTFGLLWDDPLMNKWFQSVGIFDKDAAKDIKADCEAIMAELESSRNDDAAAMLAHAYNLARAMHGKIVFHERLTSAYSQKDRKALEEVRDVEVPKLAEIFKDLSVSFRKQWMRRNKPFGLETIQLRLGGQVTRLEETALRIDEFLEGKIESIAELDVTLDAEKDIVSLLSLYPSFAYC